MQIIFRKLGPVFLRPVRTGNPDLLQDDPDENGIGIRIVFRMVIKPGKFLQKFFSKSVIFRIPVISQNKSFAETFKPLSGHSGPGISGDLLQLFALGAGYDIKTPVFIPGIHFPYTGDIPFLGSQGYDAVLASALLQNLQGHLCLILIVHILDFIIIIFSV